MGLFRTSSQIPEIANLSVNQRRYVEKECLYWLRNRPWVKLSSHGILVASVLLGFVLRGKFHFSLWSSIAISVMAVLALSQLHEMIWNARWRPEVRRFLEAHRADLDREDE